MTEQTIEAPKTSRGWTPERRAAASAAAKARFTKKPADAEPVKKPKDARYATIEDDCRRAFERLFNYVTKNGTENVISKDEETGEEVLRMFPMDAFKIKPHEEWLRASFRCGWNEVDDPKKVANAAWKGFAWTEPPVDVDISRANMPDRPRSEITFELFWEK